MKHNGEQRIQSEQNPKTPVSITLAGFSKEKTCLFTGHRDLGEDKIVHIVPRLEIEIDKLINQGVNTFISGAALGFDFIASTVIMKKQNIFIETGEGEYVRHILALPFRDFDRKWPSDKHRAFYREVILPLADEVIYVSDDYDQDVYRRRNQFMVDNAAHCLCALMRDKSGTGQTVRMAKKQGLSVINVAE